MELVAILETSFFAENLHLTDIFLFRLDCRQALQVDQRPEQVRPAAGAQRDIADDRRTDALMDSAAVETEITRAGAIRRTGERTAKVIINDTASEIVNSSVARRRIIDLPPGGATVCDRHSGRQYTDRPLIDRTDETLPNRQCTQGGSD